MSIDLAVECLRCNDLVGFKHIVTTDNVNLAGGGYCGWTILHYACDNMYNKFDNPEYLTYLVDTCGANINARTTLGRTSLNIVAARTKYMPRCFFKLLELHANTNLSDVDGDTPMNMLVMYRNYDSDIKPYAWTLLEYGANHWKDTVDIPSWLDDMVTGRTFARRSAIIMFGIRNRSPLFRANNKDVARLISQCVWKSRVNFKEWAYPTHKRAIFGTTKIEPIPL